MRRDLAFWALTIPAIGLIIYGKDTSHRRLVALGSIWVVCLVTPETDAKS